MVYKVKWVIKLDEKLGLSDEEYQKKMDAHGMSRNPSHTDEQHATRLRNYAHVKKEIDAGNLLARGSTHLGKEIHTVAVWKSKAAFAKSFKHQDVQDYRKLMEETGWVAEITTP
jgi:hypothetical protein